MPPLEPGARVDHFSIPILDGGSFSLDEALAKGPVVLAFFKITCPVCQYSFPFYDRVHRAYGDKVSWFGVSQDEAGYTSDFAREFSVSFPVLLDDTESYAVSNQFGLENVPTVFLVGQDRRVQFTSVGWVKTEVEELNQKLAQIAGRKPAAIFRSGERVEAWKAG